MKYLLKIVIFIIVLNLGCNTSSEYSAVCEEAKSLTSVQMEQQLIHRKLIWHTTIDEVVYTSDDTVLVFISDNHIKVMNVPKHTALKLNKGDPFNFIGTIKEFNEDCFGVVEFNEPYE